MERKPKREQKPKNVKYFDGNLQCQRCANFWTTSGLNPERKTIGCPICGMVNDIREAIGSARSGAKYERIIQ
jgi:hypothetical protein